MILVHVMIKIVLLSWCIRWINIFFYLCCSKYWANWICRALPEIVMIRSLEPWAGSSIVMNAFDSMRIRRIRVPALPIIAPANWRKKTTKSNFNSKFSHLCYFRRTHIFRNCNLCSFSSLFILSIVIWQIISQVTVTAEIVVQTEHWSIVAATAKAIFKCIVAAQIRTVAHAIESIHQAIWAVCAVCTVEIVEATHTTKAIVAELIEIWSIEIAVTQCWLTGCPWANEAIAITISDYYYLWHFEIIKFKQAYKQAKKKKQMNK